MGRVIFIIARLSAGYIEENEMTDLEKLKNTLTEIGIDFKVKEKPNPSKESYGNLLCNQVIMVEPDYGDDTYYGWCACFLDGKFV